MQETPSPPPRRKGPSLKDRVRGASLAQDDVDLSQQATNPDPDPHPAPGAEPAAAPETGASSPPVPTETSTPAPAAESASSATTGNPGLERIVELWDNIRMDVKALNRRTEALLQQADPVHVEGTHLTLVAAYPFHQKRLNDNDTRGIIEDVVERRSGTRMTVSSISRDEARQIRTQRGNAAPPEPPGSNGQPSSRESTSTQHGRTGTSNTDASGDDDESDPAGASAAASNGLQLDATADNDEPARDGSSALDTDEARIEAAINIFDAELVEDDR